ELDQLGKEVSRATTSPAGVPAPRRRAGPHRRQVGHRAGQEPGHQSVVPKQLDPPGSHRRRPHRRPERRRAERARRAAPKGAATGVGERDPQACGGLLRSRERAPKIRYSLVRELAENDIPVAVACRVLGVSRSGYTDWLGRPASIREQRNTELVKIGAPRLWWRP